MNTHAANTMVILASSSPYRRMLLERLQLPFTCQNCDIDETPYPGETPGNLVMRLARKKAESASGTCPGAIIIGSDQVAVHGKEVLNKPGGYEQARQQLRRLSGQRAVFHTGICVLNSSTGSVQTDDIEITVEFRKLTDVEIERYLHTEQPYACAGSFKSEGLGISLLVRMQGDDPTALIGLPLIRLAEMLRNQGLKLP